MRRSNVDEVERDGWRRPRMMIAWDWWRPPVHRDAQDPARNLTWTWEHCACLHALRDSSGGLTTAGSRPIRHKPHHVIVVGVVVDSRDPGRIGRSSVGKRDDHDQAGQEQQWEDRRQSIAARALLLTIAMANQGARKSSRKPNQEQHRLRRARRRQVGGGTLLSSLEHCQGVLGTLTPRSMGVGPRAGAAPRPAPPPSSPNKALGSV